MHNHEYDNMARLEDTHWWYVGMAGIAADWLRRLPGFSPSERVLDAGCGTGGACRWLENFGRVYGLDRHPLALRHAGAKGAQCVVQGDVQALPFANASFGLLTSFDVLYHTDVVSDWGALREFARVLRPGGWLLLRLPAYNWLRGAHDRQVQTRHRYTNREVSAKLRSVGLQPVRVTYVNSLLLAPAIIWRLLQQIANSQPASDLWLPPRPINRFLKLILRVERAWLRWFNLPAGLGVLALARKETP
ncbi:MAG TPA: class I SAM-dependent methyltransferase [Verrucomicrobiae bacterium]|nr:class I SAM-dependent methyltransferase [Verrucomicrobiae bacterium]